MMVDKTAYENPLTSRLSHQKKVPQSLDAGLGQLLDLLAVGRIMPA